VAGAIRLRTDASATGTHFHHFWSRVVGAVPASFDDRSVAVATAVVLVREVS
jgi:hypothetical protein